MLLKDLEVGDLFRKEEEIDGLIRMKEFELLSKEGGKCTYTYASRFDLAQTPVIECDGYVDVNPLHVISCRDLDFLPFELGNIYLRRRGKKGGFFQHGMDDGKSYLLDNFGGDEDVYGEFYKIDSPSIMELGDFKMPEGFLRKKHFDKLVIRHSRQEYDFSESEMECSFFNTCLLQNSKFDGAKLAGSVFYRCSTEDISFRGADLRGCKFISSTSFTNVDFTGADLRFCEFRDTSFPSWNTNFTNSIWCRYPNLNLQNAKGIDY